VHQVRPDFAQQIPQVQQPQSVAERYVLKGVLPDAVGILPSLGHGDHAYLVPDTREVSSPALKVDMSAPAEVADSHNGLMS
jgi:hypothetical protein